MTLPYEAGAEVHWGLLHRHPLLRSVMVEPGHVVTGLEVHPCLACAIIEVRVTRAVCEHPTSVGQIEPTLAVGGTIRVGCGHQFVHHLVVCGLSDQVVSVCLLYTSDAADE